MQKKGLFGMFNSFFVHHIGGNWNIAVGSFSRWFNPNSSREEYVLIDLYAAGMRQQVGTFIEDF
eukprot:snap_masked-scaffold_5-processed-gene-15.30-mRNA-1 protein AED:1.00 eAED:1.00 QI:0/0/0/0/1/1/2/0/63